MESRGCLSFAQLLSLGLSPTQVRHLELLPGGELSCATDQEGLRPGLLSDGPLALALVLVYQEPVRSGSGSQKTHQNVNMAECGMVIHKIGLNRSSRSHLSRKRDELPNVGFGVSSAKYCPCLVWGMLLSRVSRWTRSVNILWEFPAEC